MSRTIEDGILGQAGHMLVSWSLLKSEGEFGDHFVYICERML